MSALYEIQEDILSCIDLKTGEIIDVERLHELQMERRQRTRRTALNSICPTVSTGRRFRTRSFRLAGARARESILTKGLPFLRHI